MEAMRMVRGEAETLQNTATINYGIMAQQDKKTTMRRKT